MTSKTQHQRLARLMSNEAATLSGPDLEQGIDDTDLKEGGLIEGHAHGKQILLARHGGQVFALDARCTHYGAPLADGLIVGDSIRCPWHHACFSLRNGRVDRPPALSPLACYSVSERQGKLRVLDQHAEPRTPPVASKLRSVVIVGAGAAGSSAAETLRGAGYVGEITLIGAEDAAPYDRPNLSKDYLAGTAPEEWLPLHPPEYYTEKDINLLLGSRVTRIDTQRRSVSLANGAVLAYDALLLATGARPNELSIPGARLAHVHALRSLADSRRLIASLPAVKRAVLVGAGFISLEVAAALRAREIEVSIVAPEQLPLERVLGAELGAELKRLHEGHGVVFHLGTKPTAIDQDAVVLEDGTRLPADLVVVGIGVRPDVALAEAAGLKVDHGVQVDEFLCTSDPCVYAAGDIARWTDLQRGEQRRVEHWVVAQRQGQVAALNILGREQVFDAVPFFWSVQYDLTVSFVGHAVGWERVDIDGSIAAHDCAVAFRRGTQTLAVATLGRDQLSLQAETAMEQGDEAALHKLVPPPSVDA